MDQLKYKTWETISVQEMKAYLGFCIVIGTVKLPEIEDYWKADPYFHYAPVASKISRERGSGTSHKTFTLLKIHN